MSTWVLPLYLSILKGLSPTSDTVLCSIVCTSGYKAPHLLFPIVMHSIGWVYEARKDLGKWGVMVIPWGGYRAREELHHGHSIMWSLIVSFNNGLYLIG